MNIGIPAFQIETALQTLLDDLAAWRKFDTYDLIERAAQASSPGRADPSISERERPLVANAGQHPAEAGRMRADAMARANRRNRERDPRGIPLGDSRADNQDYAVLIQLHRAHAMSGRTAVCPPDAGAYGRTPRAHRRVPLRQYRKPRRFPIEAFVRIDPDPEARRGKVDAGINRK